MARRRRPAADRMPQPKKINCQQIDAAAEPEPYEILAEMLREHHTDLAEANIGLAWRFGWKTKGDGLLILGKCQKATDLQRLFQEYDFVIVLNHEVWHNPEWTATQKRALIDHELCHAAIAKDANGEPKYDVRGRQVYRIRKHEIEEFREVIDRHGLYKADLEKFAETIERSKQQLSFPEREPAGAAS